MTPYAGIRSLTPVHPLVFAVSLIPAMQLVIGLFTGGLGANPVEVITHTTGTFALVFLMITLGMTPLQRVTGYPNLMQLRRTLGLFAFFYAVLHMSTFVVLDHYFELAAILKDVVRRPHVTAGTVSFLLMVPLAATSTKRMIRKLGGRRWHQLHRLVYISAVAGVVHFFWLVKVPSREPVIFASVLALLLGYRIAMWRNRRRKKGCRPYTI
jgi:sulfoxide reductase heme-binding subunit YedZ